METREKTTDEGAMKGKTKIVTYQLLEQHRENGLA
jgi:hypothetical protein